MHTITVKARMTALFAALSFLGVLGAAPASANPIDPPGGPADGYHLRAIARGDIALMPAAKAASKKVEAKS